MKIACRFGVCLALLVAGVPAIAQPPVQQLDPTVIVAPFPRNPLRPGTLLSPSRTERGRAWSGSSVTVISGDEIRRSGRMLLHEVLRQVPGLDVVRSGAPGQQTSVFLRGAASRHTKVLLDGIPLNDPGSPSRAFDFATFSADNIERIEILRGPQGTLYGSDAIGGVINIITRRGEGPPRFRLSTMGGRYSTFEQSANLSGSTESVYYSLGGSFYETNGFTTAAERLGNSESDGFRNGTLSGRAGWLISDNADVDLVFRYNKSDAQLDAFTFPIGPTDDLLRNLRNESFAMRTQVRLLMLEGDLEQKFGFSYVNYHRDDTNPGLFYTPFFDADTLTFDWQANLTLADRTAVRDTLTAGFVYVDEDASSAFASKRSLNAAGVYLQNQLLLWNEWSIVTGVRWDEYKLAGTAATYRATSRYTFRDLDGAAHASIGTGFRAPAIFELFDPSLGNDDLRSEESFGWELGYEQVLANDRLVIDATYFRNDFDDLIVFQFDGTGPFGGHLQNVEQALTTGVELTASLQVGDDTSLSGAYTRTDARNRTQSAPLVRRPRNKFNVAVTHRLLEDRASVSLRYRWTDKRHDFDGGGAITTLDEYSLVQISGDYSVNDRLRLFMRLDNVTDELYEEVYGFATPRIGLYAGAVMTFGGDPAGKEDP